MDNCPVLYVNRSETLHSARKMITLLLATSVFLFFAEGSLDDHALRTKCNIPSVKKGQTTTLTCNFNDDVNDLQKNFKIVRDTSGDEKVVLLCDMSTGKPNCQSEPGYSFAGNENGSLYVLIPRASDIHVGRYSCQLLNSQSDNYESCSFSLKRADTTCTIPAVPVGHNAKLTCYFNKNMSLLHTNIKVTHTFDDVQDTVLLCHWKDGIPNCQAKDGFVFSGVMNNKLIITIPRATLNHAGDYTCSEQSSTDDSADTCSFSLHDIPVFNPEQRTSSDSEVKSEKNEVLLENETILIILSIIVALAIVVVVTTSALYICWRRRTSGEKYSMQRDLENVMNEESSTHIKALLLGEKPPSSKIYRLS